MRIAMIQYGYGMSSLTDEQRRRIDENRARALAKLAEKKAESNRQLTRDSSRTDLTQNYIRQPSSAINGTQGVYLTKQNTNFHDNNRQINQASFVTKQNTNFYNRQTGCPSVGKIIGVNNRQTKLQFANKDLLLTSHSQGTSSNVQNRNKNINDELGKKKCAVSGTCVLVDRTRFKVVVGFHSKLIGLFKTLPSRSYDAKTQAWSFHVEDYQKLMALCKPLAGEVELSGLPNGVLNLFLSKPPKIRSDLGSDTEIKWELIDTKLKDSLMPFQKEGVSFSIKQNGRILLADDMGLGKTIQAIAVACYYRRRWPLLVVVPSSLRMTWKRAFTRWLPSLQPGSVNVVLTGKDETNAGLVNVISYDLLVKKVTEIKQVGYEVIIVDECHAIKNCKTERTKAILPLLKASSHVILMSGTPALSRPSELYTQISAVNPKLFPSYHQYGIRYCAGVKNNFGWDYSGSSNMEELQLILEEGIMIRRLKKVVMDQLPSKTREMIFLDPSLIKEKTLAKAEKQLVKAKEKDRHAALLEYFSETCSVKAAAVREYILDLVEGGHKVIVFAHHREMLDVICQALIKKKIEYIRIDGRTPSEKRQHFCDQFQRNWETRIAVLSMTAANTGLTLTEATCVVFAELFWNPGALVQAEDRAYRIGQKNSVVIHYLIARKTADDYLWPLIQKKLDVLSEAGLNKESFSDLDTKTFQDPKQRNLKVLFESLVEELQSEECMAESCKEKSETENTNKNEKHKVSLWNEKQGASSRKLGSTSSSLFAGSSDNPELPTKSNECFQNDWFDELYDDDWDEFPVDILDDIQEPNAKRKRV